MDILITDSNHQSILIKGEVVIHCVTVPVNRASAAAVVFDGRENGGGGRLRRVPFLPRNHHYCRLHELETKPQFIRLDVIEAGNRPFEEEVRR